MAEFNVLSAFDGMSCAQIALNNCGVQYSNYFASEIEKNAIKVTQSNYTNTVQLGDITKVTANNLPKIHLLCGGSPCQGFSLAGNQLNFDDPRSKLFFEFVRLKEELNATYFFLENVKMSRWAQDAISRFLGCEPIGLNSSLVSAQNRERFYWTNIPFTMPQTSNLTINDIIEREAKRKYENFDKVKNIIRCKNYYQYDISGKGHKSQNNRAYYLTSKSPTLSKSNADEKAKIWIGGKIGFLTINEMEKLQTVPIDYTKGVSDTARRQMLGNGWTVKIIEQFFKNIGQSPTERPTTMQLF